MGFRTFFGTWVAPGARVTFCGPAGVFEDTFTENNRVATLNAALARCRSGKGDVVILLPGYAENVTAADFFTNLVTGTKIIGTEPLGSFLMPTLTFTAAAATFLLDQQSVTLHGIRFVPGIDAVANYVTVSAAGCRISECLFFGGTATTDDPETPLILATGADSCVIENNKFYSIGTAVNTNLILASGTGLNGLVIRNNFLYGSCATTGVVNVTGSAQGFEISGNTIHQLTGTTPLGIRFTDTALVGNVFNNRIYFSTDVTVLTAAINFVGVTNSNIRCTENYGSDEDSLGGVLVPTATGLE
jgi:hypothetical protein